MKKLLLLDTFNFLHRAYHALPNTFLDPRGEPINAVYGVASMLINVLGQINPDYVFAAMDDIAPTFRVEGFTGYKAHRKPMEDELSSQIPKMYELLDAFNINKISVAGYEADDIIGTMAKKYAGSQTEVLLVSNDQDMWQLINPFVMVMNPSTKGEVEWIGEKEVMARMGFTPKQVPEYKGLKGDPSDNIPGVFGIGEKTAKKLIADFSNIDNIYKNIGKINPESLRKKLMENYETAIMSRNLAQIVCNMPLNIRLQDCAYKKDMKKMKEILSKYNFKSLLKRAGLDEENKKPSTNVPKGQMSLI